MTETKTDHRPAAPQWRGQLWKWTRRVLAGLAGLVVALLLAGMLYQYVATKVDEYRYPAPGEMVDVGGYGMHLYCTGEGGPTVVMEAGGGGTMLDWQRVQPQVAKFARVCTYDRAGMGWSERNDQPRTSRQFVEELRTMLGDAGVRGPYVLVGHSLGGSIVQLYASRYPDEVAGMVLVDSGHLDWARPLEASQPPPVLTKFLATIGVIRLPYTLQGETPGQTSPDLADEQAAITSHTKHVYEAMDEFSSTLESYKQQLSSPMSLGDKPLAVLTAGSLKFPGLSKEQMDQVVEAHDRTQAELPRYSENSEQTIVKNSGHYIQVERPDTVIDAIRQVEEAVRNGGSV